MDGQGTARVLAANNTWVAYKKVSVVSFLCLQSHNLTLDRFTSPISLLSSYQMLSELVTKARFQSLANSINIKTNVCTYQIETS